MSTPTGQPAYVLHSRAYRENSALVDFLTPRGLFRAVLRSAKGSWRVLSCRWKSSFAGVAN